MAGGPFRAIDYAESIGVGGTRKVTDRVSQPYVGGNKIRNRAISGDLANILTAVGNELDVYFVVESGGQTSSRDSKLKGVRGGWTGSHRHDAGNAGDVMAYTIDEDGNKHFLDFAESDDRDKWSEIVRLSVSLGAEGIGAGESYMGTKTVHIGFGSSATWGSVDGSAASPDWLVSAHSEGLRTPPMSIPDVATFTDFGAPRPLPNAVRFGALAEVEALRTGALARTRLLDSAAMYGVRAPGAVPPENIDPGKTFASGDIYSEVPWVGAGHYDPVTATWVSPTWGDALQSMIAPRSTYDPVGDGPSSWFDAPDAALGGLGGVVLVGSGLGAAIVAAEPPLPRPSPMIKPGNIDIDARKIFVGPDGDIRTENSISIGTGEGEVLIPTVIDGKQVSEEEAIRHYRETGENLGTFATPADADNYARQLHLRQDRVYRDKSPTTEAAKEYAILPSGNQIEVGTHRNSQGDLVTVTKGSDGKAVITKVEVPWYLKEGDGTIVGDMVKQQVVQTATEEAKKAIDTATTMVSDTAAGLTPTLTGAIDAAKTGLGGFFGDLMTKAEYAASSLTKPDPNPNSNSVEKLEQFTTFVYGGILPIDSGDDLEDDPGADPIKLRPPSVIPSTEVGRWVISPTRVVESIEIKAPALNTAIAFDPTFSVKQTFSTAGNAEMALAFDRFTVPETIAVKPRENVAPRFDNWELLDGPSWNEAMKRRDEWVRSTTKAPAVKAPTETETRTEQNATRRVTKAETSTSTVATPSRPGITGETAAPAKVAPTPRPPIQRVPVQPSTKPVTRTIQVENPKYAEWRRLHGTPVVQAPTEQETRNEQNIARRQLQVATPTPPTVPPPPPRYIEKRVTVQSPTTPTRNSQSSMSGGLYVVGPGDTLSAISKRTGVSVAELQRINGIGDPDRIYAGAKLRISQTGNAIAPAPRTSIDTTAAAKRGAERGAVTQTAKSSDVRAFKGSATDRTYVVGKIYVNSQGVRKMATADGKFVEV